MKRLVMSAAVTAAALLVAAPPSIAKGVTAASVCGASECRDVEDGSLLQPLVEGAMPTDPPDHPSGWFRTTVTVAGEGGASDRFSFAALPRERVTRGEDGTWMPMSRRSARAFRRVTRGLDPLPASRLPGATPQPPPTEPAAPAGSRGGVGGGAMPWRPLVLGALLAAALATLVRRRALRAR